MAEKLVVFAVSFAFLVTCPFVAADAGNVLKEAGKGFGKVGKVVEQGVKEVGKVLEKVGKEAEKGVKEVGKGLVKVGKVVEEGVKEAGKGLGKVGKEVEKGVKEVGKGLVKVGKVVEEGVKEAGKGLGKVGKEVEKGVKEVGKGLEKVVEQVEALFSSICRGLKIPEGDCSICYTSEGGDYGEVYACEGGDPRRGVPASRVKTTKEEHEDIQRWREWTVLKYEELEPWIDGQSRFVPRETILFSPIPPRIKMTSVTKEGALRGDGKGEFLVLRALTDESGKYIGARYHGGVDYATVPGDAIRSPVDGTVLRVTNAYLKDNRGLKAIVVGRELFEFKVLYVDPAMDIKAGTDVKMGEMIGKAQDLAPKFGKNMPNHVHFTILDRNKKRVAPSQELVIKPRKKRAD